MVVLGPLLPVDERGRTVDVRSDLTDDDVVWLNDQLALIDQPPVRYARELKEVRRGSA
jgi:hypothetical protein